VRSSVKGYWLDKNVEQKFGFIERRDLIFQVIPDNTITISTPDLIREYLNSGTDFMTDLERPVEEIMVRFPLDTTSSSYMPFDGKIRFISISEKRLETLPDSYSSLPLADKEGLVLGLEGYVLLTDNFRHIRSVSDELSITCFGGTHILAANIEKGTTTLPEARGIYRRWIEEDEKWGPPDITDFDQIYKSLDKEELKLYFSI